MKRKFSINFITFCVTTAILLVSMAASSSAQADLIDGAWTWQSLELADGNIYTPYTSQDFSPTLRFSADTTPTLEGTVEGNLGCNQLFGDFAATEESGLLISDLVTTEIACIPPEIMESEALGVDLLRSTNRFEFVDNELHLITLDGDRMILTRESVDEPNYQAELVDGNNEFAFDLYHTIRENDGNIFYSPYSISTAFGMVYAGARGNTEQQIANTFHYNLSQEDLHPTFGKLNADLIQPISDTENVTFTLDIANSLWPQSGYPFQQAFLDIAAEEYAAHVQEVDYQDETNREVARLDINGWISDKTAGKFPSLLPPGAFTAHTVLTLVNATYFYAEWVEFFEEARDDAFELLDGSTVTVPMMRTTQYLDYACGQGYQTVALPYKGNRMQMVVVLPDEGQFTEVEEQLTPTFLNQAMEKFDRQEISLTFPEFDFKSKYKLNDILESLGMTDAFDRSTADFSGMDGTRNLFINRASHDASITVNESGTEGVGVTIITFVPTSADPDATFPMALDIDRPFIFFIRDKTTDSILFAGRVLNPIAEEDGEAPLVTGTANGDVVNDGIANCAASSSTSADSQRVIYLPIVD